MSGAPSRPLRSGIAIVVLAAATAVSAEVFVDVTASAGLSYVQHAANEPPDCLLVSGSFCQPERMSGGAAAGDADGDGRVDLYVTRLEAHDLLFRNRGDGTFEDVTVAAGLDAWVVDSNGAAWVDVDKDGDLDLYVSSFGTGRYHLFLNDGAGHFTEAAVARGVALDTGDLHVGYGIAVGDYDGDGWPDLFVAEWRPDLLAGNPNTSNSRLLHNLGAASPGHFEDTTIAAGVDVTVDPAQQSWVFAPAFVDLDADGHPDLALAADFGTSRLYWNDGDGTFTNGTVAAGVGTDENGMGSTFGDVDGDLDLDWFVTSIHDPAVSCPGCDWGITGNRLYRYDGGRSFSDATDAVGVRAGFWGWGAAFFESDNDGDLDLAMTNGVNFPDSTLSDPTIDDPWNADPMRFWRNAGGSMTETSAAVGLTETASGKGLLTFDYDEDGDLDLFLVNNEQGGRLYRNDGGNEQDWLQVELRGRSSTSSAWGARIEVETTSTGPTQLRIVGASTHFLGQSERVAHFGLGASGPGNVHRVEVTFPSGAVARRYAVARNQRILVVEPLLPPVPGLGLLGAGVVGAGLLGVAARLLGRRSPRSASRAAARAG